MHETLHQFMSAKLPEIDKHMNRLLAATDVSATLKDSMTYSINAGGKRIRPLLVLATLDDLGVDLVRLL